MTTSDAQQSSSEAREERQWRQKQEREWLRQRLTSDRTVSGCLGTPAWENRWTGKPHEHKREIERRLRQTGGR